MLRACRVISIILFYQIFYQLFFPFSSPPLPPPPHFFSARHGYKYGRGENIGNRRFHKNEFSTNPRLHRASSEQPRTGRKRNKRLAAAHFVPVKTKTGG